MRWSDVITLIAQTPDTTTGTGFSVPGMETARVVYGNKHPAWNSQFFQGQQLGVNIQFRFTVRASEYGGEILAEYDGRRYRIFRAEESENGEFVYLTLSDMAERSEAV